MRYIFESTGVGEELDILFLECSAPQQRLNPQLSRTGYQDFSLVPTHLLMQPQGEYQEECHDQAQEQYCRPAFRPILLVVQTSAKEGTDA